ncbi:MAG: SDR family NAD(P)-dependent oxidoreductase [Phycisphaerae bacterium]|nr:SDR family NAD(P)-dependent oxidoreductase [Phycisphaerae bacterium]
MAVTESKKLISLIAPALRLLIDAENPRVIRFSDSSEEASESALTFEPPADVSIEQIVQKLSLAIQNASGSVPAVMVPGLGVFSVWDKPITSGRAAGKVAVVTGAAQGFGLEIAQHLIAQGAYIALTDINKQGAIDAAEKLCKTFGQDRAIGLGINVTDGASIGEALHQVVCRYGGLDVFISNAGVLKAESVKTQPEKDFDFVTSVNYKGYFLCVQKIAPILAVQHLACADYRSDIIQINSKSGLVGSNRNAAYAGSKFGGLGLTQSFALELIEDGIKVNAVCPGNFFDGPLWSDPENGLFVQYLRTGKIPDAKTIEDVRKGYEAKVPMGRGCTTQDVMQAVFYLMDQKYETGQAMPVTGGQVMLS